VGEKKLAIRLYRQVQGASGAAAKAAVEKLSQNATPTKPPSRAQPAPTRFLYSVALVLAAFYATYLAAQFNPVLGSLLWLLLLLVCTRQITSRVQIQRARERGLWPQLGELPTLEHVKRLAQAGEKIMAIKLYRQMHGASLADAKAAVEKLAG
jgi:ribosomal protein L7/L12